MTKRTRNDSDVCIIGEIVCNGVFVYEGDGEKFYEILIKVADFQTELVGDVTFLPVIISERVFENVQSCKGKRILVNGCIYSRAKKGEDGRSRIHCEIRAQYVSLPDVKDSNIASLRGYLCKPPIIKKTADGQTLVNALLCLSRDEHISDYIPIVCTNKMAECLEKVSVGDEIAAIGVIRGQDSEDTSEEDLKIIMTNCIKVPPKPQV